MFLFVQHPALAVLAHCGLYLATICAQGYWPCPMHFRASFGLDVALADADKKPHIIARIASSQGLHPISLRYEFAA